MKFKTFLLFLAFSATAFAQSAQWSVSPIYKSLSRFAPELYKVSAEDKVGIMSAEGAMVYNTTADSISNLSEGYAIALKKEKKRMRIVALIDEKGNATALEKELYADEDSHFAGGQMLVKNKKNKFGFINNEGNLIVECQMSKKPEVNANVNESENISENFGPMPFAELNKYGYKIGEKVILPPQFISAQSFYGDYAIAQTATGFGILKLVQQPFSCKMTKAEMVDGMEDTEFVSSLPANKDAALRLVCVDSTGMKFESEGKKSDDKATYNLSSFRERRTFTVVASDEKGELVLWNSVFAGNDDAQKDDKTSKKGNKKTKKTAKKTTKKKR